MISCCQNCGPEERDRIVKDGLVRPTLQTGRSERKVFSMKPEVGVIVCFSLFCEWRVIVILALQILNILGCTDYNLLFMADIDKMTSKFTFQVPNLSFTHTWVWEYGGICQTFYPCGSCVAVTFSDTVKNMLDCLVFSVFVEGLQTSFQVVSRRLV